MTRALLALLLVTGCTAARYDRFEHYATGALVAVDLGVVACDWGQTTHASHHGQWDWAYKEGNPILGHRPTLDKITIGMAAGAVGMFAGSRVLPRGWRLAFALTVAAAQFRNVTTQWNDPAHPRRACGY